MRTITTFDPTNTLSDSFDTTFGGQASDAQIYIWNDSIAALKFDLGSGRKFLIPPNVGYPLLKRPYPIPTINWTQDYLLNASNAPIAKCTVEYYEPGEPLPSEVPIPIVRAVSVGNTVQTGSNVGTANGVTYDQTAINGETASSVTSSAAAGGAAPLVDVTDANPTGGKRKFVQKTGEFDINGDGSATAPAFHGTADQATNMGDGTSGAYLTAGDSGGSLHVKPTASNRGLSFETRDAVGTLHQIASAAADGTGGVFHGAADSASKVVKNTAWTGSDTFGWPSDSVSGNSLRSHVRFSGTGSGTFTHAMLGGVTPTFIAITTTETNSTETVGVDTITSTTVHVNQGASGWPWIGFATAG